MDTSGAHLNYSRQVIRQFSAAIASPGFKPENAVVLSHAVKWLQRAQKFMLPPGGRLHDDYELKALDETRPLRLPFPVIALEYQREQLPSSGGFISSSRAVVIARQEAFGIVVMPIVWLDDYSMWGPQPEVALPLVGFLDRRQVRDGRVSIVMHNENTQAADSDYSCELGALLCLLNVLNCGNVGTQISRPKNANQPKGAIPFDSYHVLTIDTNIGGDGHALGGTHRSPREHLRRGHIRRLGDGRTIWVNAAIVGAGHAGRIAKDYSLHA